MIILAGLTPACNAIVRIANAEPDCMFGVALLLVVLLWKSMLIQISHTRTRGNCTRTNRFWSPPTRNFHGLYKALMEGRVHIGPHLFSQCYIYMYINSTQFYCACTSNYIR